jgi:tetratricopeptide (TPR) repeat protein
LNRKTLTYLSASLLALLVAATASAQAWRGTGRLQGVVTDPSGKPIAGAKVILVWQKAGNTGGPNAITTNAKGKWAAGGLAGGPWNVDVEAPGFLTRQMSANISELERLQPEMKIVLEPKPEEKPQAAEQQQQEAIMVGGVEISPEIAQAIEAANNFMKEQKWAEAAVEYEKAVAVLSTNMQLKAALARAYYGAGEKKKAIANLTEVHAADTGNVIYATLLADMLLEDGQLDAGQKVLAALPPGALSDPNTIINLGIRFVNNNKPEEAHKYFSDAVAVAPDLAAAYYYRGIAALQLKKMKEAKADLQKVIEISPDSSEAKDAKDLLAQIK